MFHSELFLLLTLISIGAAVPKLNVSELMDKSMLCIERDAVLLTGCLIKNACVLTPHGARIDRATLKSLLCRWQGRAGIYGNSTKYIMLNI